MTQRRVYFMWIEEFNLVVSVKHAGCCYYCGR